MIATCSAFAIVLFVCCFLDIVLNRRALQDQQGRKLKLPSYQRGWLWLNLAIMIVTIAVFAVEYSQLHELGQDSSSKPVMDIVLLAALILLGAVGVIKMVYDCQVLSKSQDVYRFYTMAEQVVDAEKIGTILRNLTNKFPGEEELILEDPDFQREVIRASQVGSSRHVSIYGDASRASASRRSEIVDKS